MNLYTEDQLGLKSMVADFMKKEVVPIMAEYDRKGEVPMEIVRKGFDIGLHLLEIPEVYGGIGLKYEDYCIVQEELSAHEAGFSTTFGASDLAVKAVMNAGTEEQKRYFCDFIAKGHLGAFCLTEPQAGSDAAAVRTTAVRDGDDYILNGTKCFITNGGIADIFVVIAVTDKTKGVKGLSAFLVERSMGVKSGKEEDKFGIRLSNTTDVIFEDVRVPAKNLLGEEGRGFITAMKVLERGRVNCAAGAVGVMRHAIELATEYAKTRVTFGKPIAANQGIQFMLADMKIAEESARQLMLHAARLCDAGADFQLAASAAKAYAGDCAMQVTTDAVQIFGGYGYSREYPVEKLMRDAKIFQIYEGTNQIQRMVIAGAMLK